MEILRQMSMDEVRYISEKCSQKLPRCLWTNNYLNNMMAWHKRLATENLDKVSRDCLAKFYTHRNGKKENCTIVAINTGDDHKIFVFTFDVDELTECLEKTDLINWTHVEIQTIHKDHLPAIDIVVEKRQNLLKSFQVFANAYWMPIVEGLNVKVELPEGTAFRALIADDADFCHKHWLYGHKSSVNNVRSMILLNGGFALINQKSNEILSYGFINEHLACGVLTTPDQHQKKGYGTVVAKHLTVKIAQMGLNPTTYIDRTNLHSRKVFERLGYQSCGVISWVVINAKVEV